MSAGKWRVGKTMTRDVWEDGDLMTNRRHVATFNRQADARACVEAVNACGTPLSAKPGERGQKVSIEDRLQALYEWLREPDWADEFGVGQCAEWINQRPCHVPIAARAEISALRSALATAKRDGWIAGRGAAASLLERVAEENTKSEGSDFLLIGAHAIRALEPPESLASDVTGPKPAATEGGRDAG